MTLTHSYLRVSIQHRFISTCLCAILYGARETKSVHIISVMTLRVVGTRALSGARSCGHPPRCRVLYVFNAFEFRLTFFRTRENRRESQKRMVCYEFSTKSVVRKIFDYTLDLAHARRAHPWISPTRYRTIFTM